MDISTATINRRRFLVILGLTTGAAASISSVRRASAAPKIQEPAAHPLFRRGLFAKGSRWNIPGGSLLVKRRRPITSLDGQTRFDRNSFEVIFAKGSGKHPGNGTTVLTNKDGTEVTMLLTRIRPNRHSAIVNRQPIAGSYS